MLVSVLCTVPGCRSTIGVIDGVLGSLGFEKSGKHQSADIEQIIRDALPDIGRREIMRLNNAQNADRIVFTRIPNDPVGRGTYYRERRIYEKWYAGTISSGRRARTASNTTGSRSRPESYTAVIEYRYRVYRTPEMSSRTEAATEKPVIAGKESLFERYKYSFDKHGQWNGNAGRLTH